MIEDIQKMVSDHFRVKLVDLKSKSRAKPFVTARQVAMYLIKKNLDKSLVQIGESFGGKDHTTVINAISRIKDQQDKDLELKRDIEELQSRIHNITGLWIVNVVKSVGKAVYLNVELAFPHFRWFKDSIKRGLFHKDFLDLLMS